MKEEIRERLILLKEAGYADFTAGLTPGAGAVLGVRLPLLRKIAKELAAQQGEEALEGEDLYFEEKLLRGMMIGRLKVTPQRRFELIRDFIPRIDNWAVCDSFCCSLKSMKQQQEACWTLIQPYAFSEKEFEQRFAAVMLLDYFVTEAYIDKTLGLLPQIHSEAYYASMGAAWALAECYIKFPQKTLPLLQKPVFGLPTLRRTIRKLCDSYRVTKDDKQMLRELLAQTENEWRKQHDA